MPKLFPWLRIAALTAVVGLFTAPPHAAENVASELFPPAITRNGVVGGLSFASAATSIFNSPSTLVENMLLPASAIRPQHHGYGDASVAPANATSNAIASGGSLQSDNFLVRSGIGNGTSRLAAWTAPALPGFGVQLRASGMIGSFLTERLRLNALGHESLYSVPTVIVFGTPITHRPESPTWPLMLAGIFVMTAIIRRHLRKDLPE